MVISRECRRPVAGQDGLAQFHRSIRRPNVEVWYKAELREAGAGAARLYLGDFFIKLAPSVGPVLGAAVGAWLHARYGRRVRLKVGDIEAEAQTTEEVEKLLAKAQEIQQRNQPRVIHEP